MSDYYVKSISIYDEQMVYFSGTVDLWETDVVMTLGDFNNPEFSKDCFLIDFANFIKHNKVHGVRTEEEIIEVVRYENSFKLYEDYIVGYSYTDLQVDESRVICGIKVSDKRFRFKWFDIDGINIASAFVGVNQSVPISIADYIINYADKKSFSSDLSYVLCHLERGLVKFDLNPKGRPLLAKLRLLR